MKINDFIDQVGSKYGYDSELIDALKRCVPAMIEGKTEEDVKLLMDTLDRVQIYTFDKQPQREEIDAIIDEKRNGRNKKVTFKEYDKGEYDKAISPSAYTTEPIFDDDMNIIDRIGFIYTTKLQSNGQTSNFYGTRINLSHLIHELGHAWAAQKGEVSQDENGDFTMTIGTAKLHYKVDRETHTVEGAGIEGLFIEEALNSIEEEEALYKLFGIEDYHDIPGYVPSEYQGNMTAMMRYYIEKLGKEKFEELRIQKDRSGIEHLQEIFDKTNYMKSMKYKDYYDNKKEKLESAQSTSMSDTHKKKVKDFFKEYRDLYLEPHDSKDFSGHLDNVMEQLYNFNSIKYSYDILKKDTKEAYSKTQIAILAEGYEPVHQAIEIIEERRKQEVPQVTISTLAREALKDNIRMGEVKDLQRSEEISRNGENVVKETNGADEQSL